MARKRIRSLAESLYFKLTGKSQRSETYGTKSRGYTETQARARDLIKQCGGDTKEAARRAGVSQRTMQKYAAGKQEAKDTRRAKNREGLIAAQRQSRVKPARANKLAASARRSTPDRQPPAGGSPLAIYGTIRVSSDERERWIRPGNEIPAGALDQIADIFATQGPEAAAAELQNHIGSYVPRMEIIDVTEFET